MSDERDDVELVSSTAVVPADRSGRMTRGAHASGIKLRSAKGAHRPAHAVLGERGTRRFRFTVGILSATLVGAFGALGGTAYAYFTSSGAGSAVATVGSVQAVTVETTTGTASPKLQPGSHADLKLTVTNPNAFTVTIVHIVGKSGTIAVSGAKGTCTGSSADVSVPAKTISYTVGHGLHAITVATGAYMTTTSPTGCQGATFSLPVTIKVEKR